MSAIPRLLPASRRYYSSYFSSKSGGGRYFTSAKSPKSSIIATAARQSSKSPSASKPCDSSQDGGDVKHRQPGENNSDPVDAQSTNTNTGVKAGSTSTLQGDSKPNTPSSPDETTALTAAATAWSLPAHPVVNAKDFKLNQFFSLHRPLLLLSNPSSILYPAPPNSFLSTDLSPSEEPLFASDTSGLPAPPSTILSSDYCNPYSVVSPYEDTSTSPDEDENEALSLLTHALAMTKISPMIEWEETLRRLGLDVEMEPKRVEMKEQMERELDEVRMDSTKRKRRKKMKKHKLKKRRRLTRSTRLKIGR